MSDAAPSAPAGPAGAAAPAVHISPPWLLLTVWAALVIGTLVTVSVPWAEDRYHFELGAAGLWVAQRGARQQELRIGKWLEGRNRGTSTNHG